MSHERRHRIFRYEHRSEPILPRHFFLGRLLIHTLVAFGLVMFSLGIGILGYHFIAGLSWIDALMNAAMILGGMGPVNELTNDEAKLFASIYALYAGVAFLGVFAVLIAPIVHRMLHRLHLEKDKGD